MYDKKESNKPALKLLNKLFEAGINSDTAVLAMTMSELGDIPNLTISEIPLIGQLQQSIRDKKVIAFLGGTVNE